MKQYYKKLIEKLNQNPKRVFRIAFVMLCVSLVLSFVQFFWFPIKPTETIAFPQFSSSADEKVSIYKDKEERLKKIAEELKYFKDKGQENITQQDSVRIDYLLKQYNEIRNEN